MSTGWQHGEPCDCADADHCGALAKKNWREALGISVDGTCGCMTPTPDPASPCGAAWPDGENCAMTEYPHDRPMGPSHEYIPTRCTCGHVIEAAR